MDDKILAILFLGGGGPQILKPDSTEHYFSDLTLEFDECTVLVDNTEYLMNTLQLEGIDVQYSENACEKTQEECRPGAPFITLNVRIHFRLIMLLKYSAMNYS